MKSEMKTGRKRRSFQCDHLDSEFVSEHEFCADLEISQRLNLAKYLEIRVPVNSIRLVCKFLEFLKLSGLLKAFRWTQQEIHPDVGFRL